MLERPLYCIILALCAAVSLPPTARAACKSALATESLRALDGRVDTDPAAVNIEVKSRLAQLSASDSLQAAELYAVSADAFDIQDDGIGARSAVAAARARLAQLPADAASRSLEVRLALIEADTAQTKSELAASTDMLSRVEQTLPAQSLDHACLLIVRSRLNAQLIRNAEATRDGLDAYRIATALHAPAAATDAAYQLSMTFLKAGLLSDASQMADEAIAYNRSTGQLAALSDALYIKSQVLREMHRYDAALAVVQEARELNVRLHEDIDVAYDDLERCELLVALDQLDTAEPVCVDAEKVLAAARRMDLRAVTEATLARIEFKRGRPAAAVARLDAILHRDLDQVAANDLPRLYRYRSDALSRVGRIKDALMDLQESLRLSEATDAQRSSLAAATLKERLGAERMQEEKLAVESQMLREREQTAAQKRQLQLSIALAVAAGLFLLLIAYLLWIRTRHERALRRASETLETHARVITTVREGVLLINERGHIEFANPSLLRMFGRSFEELLDAPVERLGISRRDLEDPIAETAGGLPAGARELHLHHDGKPVVLLVTSSTLKLHDGSLLVCVLQDVTELRRLEHEVLSDASSERNQLSSEVHEGLAQDLTGIALLLNGLAGKNRSDADTLNFIVGHVNHALQRTRALARGLSPVQVAGGSLTLALSRFAADIAAARSIDVVCRSELGELRLPATQSDHLYRIALECLRFAARRPDCSKLTVELRLTPATLVLTSTGNGAARTQRPLDDERTWGRITYLARVIGGTARIDEAAEGTRTTVAVPVAKLALGVEDAGAAAAAAG